MLLQLLQSLRTYVPSSVQTTEKVVKEKNARVRRPQTHFAKNKFIFIQYEWSLLSKSLSKSQASNIKSAFFSKFNLQILKIIKYTREREREREKEKKLFQIQKKQKKKMGDEKISEKFDDMTGIK